jgi:ABC-type nitrate/sulfonate/bicarbonate transport system substrate-binding protein
MNGERALGALFISVLIIFLTATVNLGSAQTPEKMRLGYSGTGINNYVLEMGRRLGLFRKNGVGTWKWSM